MENLPAEQNKAPLTLSQFLESQKGELAKALPGHVTIDRLLRVALSTINRTPKLKQATTNSLLAGVVISSQLGFELNTPLGHAWLIPYDRSVKTNTGWDKVTEAQFQIGYQGIIDLAYRSGMYKTVYAEKVYANDKFSFSYGLEKKLEHEPCTSGAPGELIGVYAVYHLKSGGSDFKYWTVDRIRAHAQKYSQSYDAKAKKFRDKSAWGDNFEGMAATPVLKELFRLAPKSIEFSKQLSLDGSVKTEITADMTEAHGIDVDFSVVERGESAKGIMERFSGEADHADICSECQQADGHSESCPFAEPPAE